MYHLFLPICILGQEKKDNCGKVPLQVLLLGMVFGSNLEGDFSSPFNLLAPFCAWLHDELKLRLAFGAMNLRDVLPRRCPHV